ncbi:SDR family oxidoreductase [Rhizorhabdus wittichii]|uniref:SDR family oxidoreductase n=1 Tax=Rhizorhabdus wittichii TaxID=160791 RepID=A0A975D207_9SPHN|nr:SDR family oxidoreductase [Rhizorhabdus wittichii]QTH21173.1 SDR family oxidoreductase [Rhizorhabdus wittichii]
MAERATVRISGRTALVTGSSQGWGLGIAKAFAHRGVDVVVTGATPARVAEAERAVRTIAAGKVASVVADLTTREGCEMLVERATAAVGTIEILVNNAGKVEAGTILETTPEQWRGVMALSLDAQFHMTQLVARRLVAEDKGGRIINMAGGAAFSGMANYASHAASKGGGMGAVLSWARELGPHGITVNALAGRIETAQSQPFLDGMRAELVAKGLPPRTNRELGYYPPDELAAAVVWLASEGAAMVNGRMLHASGPELQIWRMATIEHAIHNATEPWTPELLDRIGLADMLALGHGLEPRRPREPIVTIRK